MSNIIFYETPQGKISVSVRYENETFWLTQKAIATLFGVEVPAISKHLKKSINRLLQAHPDNFLFPCNIELDEMFYLYVLFR